MELRGPVPNGYHSGGGEQPHSMGRTETPLTSPRGQLAATLLVTVGALTALGIARFTRSGSIAPPEIELLLGFIFLGGLCLVAIDVFRQAFPDGDTRAAPSRAAHQRASTAQPAAVEAPARPGDASAGSPFLRAVIERVSAGIVACDASGRTTIFNRTARELHGVPEGAPLDGDFGAYYELYAGDGVTRLEPHEFPLARALHGETVANEEIMIASRNGWARTMTVNAHPLLDRSGLPLGALMAIEDVTERHRAEQDLRAELERARESDRLKSAFLANMSHEIRTPLNIILGYNSMIADHFHEEGDASQQPLFEAIQRASRRLMNTVHGILDISRIEVGAFEIHPVSIRPAEHIQRILAEFEDAAHEKELTLSCEIEEADAIVLFDEHCFRRALENLVDNAIKFTARGGIAIRLARGADRILTLEVRDTGIGIDAEYIPRLFQPFSQEEYGYTRRFEGSGLGLALVKSYVEFNGAEISVQSRKGEGSTFRIRFLREASARRGPELQEVPVSSNDPEVPEPESAKPLVLVVEDDSETQGYMRALLGRRYRVVVAASGEEARRQLAERGEAIRAILMDLSLKGEEDGLMLTQSLRQHPKWKEVPVIATTAHAFLEDQNRALAAGCDAFLAKPFGRAELFEAMERLLR